MPAYYGALRGGYKPSAGKQAAMSRSSGTGRAAVRRAARWRIRAVVRGRRILR